MRCIIWAAVSSKSQASEEKDSIPSQISAAREFIQHNEGWHEIAEPLSIPGHSRSYIFLADAAADTPVYTELMSLARESKIDLLICRGRDPLGRKDALIARVEEYLASYHVQIYSMAMPTRVQDPREFPERKDLCNVKEMKALFRQIGLRITQATDRSQNRIPPLRNRRRINNPLRADAGSQYEH